jgi:hypothetical protein
VRATRRRKINAAAATGVPVDARLRNMSASRQSALSTVERQLPRLSSGGMQTCGMARGNADKYQAYAEECMQLIGRMPADARPTLLRIAEAWLELARYELELDGCNADHRSRRHQP